MVSYILLLANTASAKASLFFFCFCCCCCFCFVLFCFSKLQLSETELKAFGPDTTERFVGCLSFILHHCFSSVRNKRNGRLVAGFRTRRLFYERFVYKRYWSAVFACCRNLIEG